MRIEKTWNVNTVIMNLTFSSSHTIALHWRHNERDGVSNHQPHDCLLNRLFKAQIKENIKDPRHRPISWEIEHYGVMTWKLSLYYWAFAVTLNKLLNRQLSCRRFWDTVTFMYSHYYNLWCLCACSSALLLRKSYVQMELPSEMSISKLTGSTPLTRQSTAC